MRINAQHWLTGVRRRRSPNCDDRSAGVAIDLLVVHAVSLPAGSFGTGYVDDLFMNRLDTSAHPSFADLTGVEVSAHALISRRGRVTQYVPFDRRAWHAGQSIWCGRSACNDFSIGIELEGCDTRAFTQSQYRRLAQIAKILLDRYPRLTRAAIVGHNEIAPMRKTDPGPGFSWPAFYDALEGMGSRGLGSE